MEKKNVTVCTIASFFVLGLFYVLGFNKKSVMYVVGLCVASWLITMAVGPTPALVVNIVGAYLGNKIAKEINAGLDVPEIEEKAGE